MSTSNQQADETPDVAHPRWSLMASVAKFQAKLLVDGLRDLVMSPVSLGAALAGLLFEPNDPGKLYRRLLKLGQRSERWINLFGYTGQLDAEPGIDDLFGQLESRLVEQYEQGGATASAKRAVDRSLDGLHRGLERLRERVNEDGSSEER
jgi:hypothetical protein